MFPVRVYVYHSMILADGCLRAAAGTGAARAAAARAAAAVSQYWVVPLVAVECDRTLAGAACEWCAADSFRSVLQAVAHGRETERWREIQREREIVKKTTIRQDRTISRVSKT